MSRSLTQLEIVDAIVDAGNKSWPMPIPGIGLVITALADKLGINVVELALLINDREQERFCCGSCVSKGCHKKGVKKS